MTNINFFVGFTLPDSHYIYAVLREFVIDKQIVFHGLSDYQKKSIVQSLICQLNFIFQCFEFLVSDYQLK